MERELVPLASAVFKSKRHDTGFSPEITFTPPAGTTWDLAEAGVVAKFIARTPDSATPKIMGNAVVTGSWTVRYDPKPADVDTIGAFDVEVSIVRANGKQVTMPTEGWLSWVIGPDLDDA